MKLKKRRKSSKKFKKNKSPEQQAERKTLRPRLDLAFAGGGIDLGIDVLGLSAASSDLLSQSGGAMTEDTVDRLPQIQYREPIPFPEFAKENNINGYVTLSILVNDKGSVEKVKLLDSQPEGVFDQIAMSSVRDWSFSPAEYQGRLVSVWVKQKLKFQVN